MVEVEEDINIWKNNQCKLKTPFCYSVFKPTCNCAYLSLESVNMNRLPDNVVSEMTAMKRLEVINCNLTTLPKHMEKLTLLINVDLSYNLLTEFNVDVQQWPYLTWLNLQYNNISNYNETALWQHSSLYGLFMNSNVRFSISNDATISMPMLQSLGISNNSMVLPNQFGRDQFPSLLYLYVSGNNLQNFPVNFDSLNSQLLHLHMAKCQIHVLPESYLSKFESLLYFDVRDNNISVVDSSFQASFYVDDDEDDANGKTGKTDQSKRQIRAYFHGNPVCKTDVSMRHSFSCEEMCSKYCFYKSNEVDEAVAGSCDSACNTKDCNYDQGGCSKSLSQYRL